MDQCGYTCATHHDPIRGTGSSRRRWSCIAPIYSVVSTFRAIRTKATFDLPGEAFMEFFHPLNFPNTPWGDGAIIPHSVGVGISQQASPGWKYEFHKFSSIILVWCLFQNLDFRLYVPKFRYYMQGLLNFRTPWLYVKSMVGIRSTLLGWNGRRSQECTCSLLIWEHISMCCSIEPRHSWWPQSLVKLMFFGDQRTIRTLSQVFLPKRDHIYIT